MSETTTATVTVGAVPVATVPVAEPSPTAAVVVPTPTVALSGELKTAVLAAAHAHLVKVGEDFLKLEDALEADLSTVVTEVKATVESDFSWVETTVKTEIAKLKTDLTGTTTSKVVGGVTLVSVLAAAASVVAHFAFHLF